MAIWHLTASAFWSKLYRYSRDHFQVLPRLYGTFRLYSRIKDIQALVRFWTRLPLTGSFDVQFKSDLGRNRMCPPAFLPWACGGTSGVTAYS